MKSKPITLAEHLSRAGKASAEKMTPEQRKERATKAVRAREKYRAEKREKQEKA